MKNRLRYGDIEKSSYIKNVLTLMLIVAFVCVSGRFLYKYIKQELSNKAKNPAKQEQVTKFTEVTQEQNEAVDELVKINTKEETSVDIKTYKEKFLEKLQANYQVMLKDMKINKTNYRQSDEIKNNISATIIINKDGSIDFEKMGWNYDTPLAIKEAILHTIWHDSEDRAYFEPLPNNYKNKQLVLKFVFDKSGVYYEGQLPE